MHELSVCQGLLSQVELVAATHGATRVTDVTVAIGPLAGVEATLLARAFGIARAGTVASAARLVIETVPVVVWCPDCAAATTVPPNALLCGVCGSWRVTLRSGDALMLLRLTLAEQVPTDEEACDV